MQVQCEAVPKPITAREEAQWRAMIEAVLRDHLPGVTLSGEAWREETHTDFVLCSAARRHKVALRDTVKREMSERFSVVTGATLEKEEGVPRPFPHKTCAIRCLALPQSHTTSGRLWLVCGVVGALLLALITYAFCDLYLHASSHSVNT